MKVSDLKKRAYPSKPTAEPTPLFVDEYHQLAGATTLPMLGGAADQARVATKIVTQAVVRGKGGKQRFISYARDAATGQPIPPHPKKFLPVQVLRRQEAVQAAK